MIIHTLIIAVRVALFYFLFIVLKLSFFCCSYFYATIVLVNPTNRSEVHIASMILLLVLGVTGSALIDLGGGAGSVISKVQHR